VAVCVDVSVFDRRAFAGMVVAGNPIGWATAVWVVVSVREIRPTAGQRGQVTFTSKLSKKNVRLVLFVETSSAP
jgi:hypothetical protein